MIQMNLNFGQNQNQKHKGGDSKTTSSTVQGE